MRKTICFGISVPFGQHGNEELAVLLFLGLIALIVTFSILVPMLSK